MTDTERMVQARLQAVELVRSRLHVFTYGTNGWDQERDPLYQLLNASEGPRAVDVLALLEAVTSVALSGLMTIQDATGAPADTILDALAMRAIERGGQGDVTVTWDTPDR